LHRVFELDGIDDTLAVKRRDHTHDHRPQLQDLVRLIRHDLAQVAETRLDRRERFGIAIDRRALGPVAEQPLVQ
jgi:hypothetical protein